MEKGGGQSSSIVPNGKGIYVIFHSKAAGRANFQGKFSKIPAAGPHGRWAPRTFHQQSMKEFLSLWGFWEVSGIFPGYLGKIIESILLQLLMHIQGCLSPSQGSFSNDYQLCFRLRRHDASVEMGYFWSFFFVRAVADGFEDYYV